VNNKELPKILNKNELVKKFSSVLESNDSIAKSITLQILAKLSNIMTEEKTDLVQK
jgi:hypothetical protein